MKANDTQPFTVESEGAEIQDDESGLACSSMQAIGVSYL